MGYRNKSRSNFTGLNANPRLTLNIVYRRLEELKPDPANPRRHTKKQIRQIADSIKLFGFNVPILVDCNGKIIAGYGRYHACLLLGITEAPTLCLDHLTPVGNADRPHVHRPSW